MNIPTVSCPKCDSKTLEVPAKFFLWSSDDVEVGCSTCGYTGQVVLSGWRNGFREFVVNICASILGIGILLAVVWGREWLLAFGLLLLINALWRVVLLKRAIRCHAQGLRMPEHRES